MGRKFLIIDDSALMRRVMFDIITKNSEYEVVDVANNGVEGLDKIISHPGYYDLILLDINMPKMNGLEMLEALSKHRVRETVVVVSTVAKEGAKETLMALELGAVDFVTKPENFYEVKGEGFRDNILNLIDVVCSTDYDRNVVHTTTSIPSTSKTVVQPFPSIARTSAPVLGSTSSTDVDKAVKGAMNIKNGKLKLVALACSTGGPKSLQQVIPFLPANLDAPVVMVQHMPKGFTESLAARLDGLGDIRVHEAKDGDLVEKGHVYIAPGGMHIRVEKRGAQHFIRYEDVPAVDGLKPCANIMYRSLVNCGYDEITCVVLTGMGSDGTAGIKELADSGQKIHVIGQDKDSCVVYGMPRAIAEAGLTNEVVPLNKITQSIIKNVGVS